MAVPLRATLVAQYPLPGGGKVSLTIMAESMTGEQYAMLADVINKVVPLAQSLGWKPGAEGATPRPDRPGPKRSRPAPALPPPAPPRLSAVPRPEDRPEATPARSGDREEGQ